MPFVRTRAPSQAEQAVINSGYPWVQTTTLYPYNPDIQPEFNMDFVDRLNLHQHRSRNTHLILSGTLTLVRDQSGKTINGPGRTISVNREHPAREVTVMGGTPYRGWAGPHGCVFIEGHTLLSPTTAERFIGAGTHRWEDESGPAAMHHGRRLTTTEQQREWFERETYNANTWTTPISMAEAGLLKRDDRQRTFPLESI